MKISTKNKNGFGLIETLVACAILIIVCGALLAINVVVTRDISYAKNRAVAFSLAEEGIESVRQIRDSNLIDKNSQTNWDSFVCAGQKFSTPDTIAANILYLVNSGDSGCFSASDSRIILVPDEKSSGEDISIGSQIYNRKIHFLSSGLNPPISASSDITEANAVRVVVEISWTVGGKKNQIAVSELLTNWKRGF